MKEAIWKDVIYLQHTGDVSKAIDALNMTAIYIYTHCTFFEPFIAYEWEANSKVYFQQKVYDLTTKVSVCLLDTHNIYIYKYLN